MTDSVLHSTLKAQRRQAGLSQRELARRVDVSRQALAAIESGRQVPSTALALKLARALGVKVDALFSLAQETQLIARFVSTAASSTTNHAPPQAPPRPGTRVVLARVAQRWVAHPLSTLGHQGAPACADALLIAATDHERRQHDASSASARFEPLCDTHLLDKRVLVSGCAPLLGTLSERFSQGARASQASAAWICANSTRSLDLLAAREVHVAGLHLVDAAAAGGHAALVRARFADQDMHIVHLARWRQGLVTAPANPHNIRGIEDLARPGIRLVSRDAGSGAQALLERHLAAAGLGQLLAETARRTATPLLIAQDHREVAEAIRCGAADVGVAIETCAIAFGLHFTPLAEERFDLVVPHSSLDLPHVEHFLASIDAPRFRAEAGAIAGYDTREAGHRVRVKPQAHLRANCP